MNPIPAARIVIPAVDRREILARIDEALCTGALTLGRNGEAFEAAFAHVVGARFAIAVQSGTSALEIVLRSLHVDGREVIVPTNTFFATPAAVIHAGGRPRFVDVEHATMALSVETVAAAVSPETAAVILVHIGGMVSPETPKIAAFCRDHDLVLVEDAAHAHASSLDGRMAGTFGAAAAFSFYPTKVIAGGEGGMITTDDDALADEARVYRDQGKGSFHANFHTRMGANWRMSEPHAAIVLSQLHRLDEFIERRQVLARRYDDALASLDLGTLTIPDAASSNFYKYVAFLPDGVDRTLFKQHLRAEYDIGLAGEVYDTPLHHQPIFSELDDRPLPARSGCAPGTCACRCIPRSPKPRPTTWWSRSRPRSRATTWAR